MSSVPMRRVALVFAAFLIGYVSCATAPFKGLAAPEGLVDASINVINDTSFEIKGLSFTAAAPGVYWWGAKLANPAVLASGDEDTVNNAVMKALLANGKRINPTHYDKKLSNADITVTLSPGLKLSDYDVVSFWCEDIKADLGHFVVPKGNMNRKLLSI
jgi:hypothetical protein